ncbi:AraC family transcriptional regulator [Streptomyces sp. NPDC005963]|uniref:AraC family transcriptional regulator n=1 Tax=Streptomyces sp. NPDC005963 TaxID=3156721 RepID=UPI0033DB9F3A
MRRSPGVIRDRSRPDALATLLSRIRVGTGRFGRIELGAPWGVRMGPRDTVTLHHPLDGEMWLEADGPMVRIGPGDLVILPHGVPHSLKWRPDARVMAEEHWQSPPSEDGLSVRRRFGGDGARTVVLCAELTLTGAARGLLMRALPPVIHFQPDAGGDPVPGLRRILDGLREEVRDGRSASPLLAARLVEVLLLQGIRAELERPAAAGTWRAALGDDRVGRALDALYGAPGHPWSVAELARVAGMSRAAFAPLFRELVGESPIAHLTGWRMALAKTALSEQPDLPIGRIAASVGYGSEFAFSAAFRRVVGMPPGRYRATVEATGTP